jgi:MarR family transcriptional regulator, transcriptional regulator for hemolysin
MPDSHRPTERPIGPAVHDAGKRLARAFDEALSEAGGTLPMWLILLALKQQRWRTQLELAEAVGIGNPTLTHHVDALERAGLVARVRDQDDRRVIRLELTDPGEAMFQRLRRVATSFNRRLTSGFSSEELAQLRRLLERLAANVAE